MSDHPQGGAPAGTGAAGKEPRYNSHVITAKAGASEADIVGRFKEKRFVKGGETKNGTTTLGKLGGDSMYRVGIHDQISASTLLQDYFHGLADRSEKYVEDTHGRVERDLGSGYRASRGRNPGRAEGGAPSQVGSSDTVAAASSPDTGAAASSSGTVAPASSSGAAAAASSSGTATVASSPDAAESSPDVMTLYFSDTLSVFRRAGESEADYAIRRQQLLRILHQLCDFVAFPDSYTKDEIEKLKANLLVPATGDVSIYLRDLSVAALPLDRAEFDALPATLQPLVEQLNTELLQLPQPPAPSAAPPAVGAAPAAAPVIARHKVHISECSLGLPRVADEGRALRQVLDAGGANCSRAADQQVGSLGADLAGCTAWFFCGHANVRLHGARTLGFVERGRPAVVDPGVVVDVVRQQPNLRCVVLNGCSSLDLGRKVRAPLAALAAPSPLVPPGVPFPSPPLPVPQPLSIPFPSPTRVARTPSPLAPLASAARRGGGRAACPLLDDARRRRGGDLVRRRRRARAGSRRGRPRRL